MKIAYICADPGVPIFGNKGCSIHVQEVLRVFLNHGHQVELFAMRKGEDPPQDLKKISLYLLPSIPKCNGDDREAAGIATNRSLKTAIQQSGPFDLVYERYSLWSYEAIEYAHANHIPGILEVNSPLIEEQATYRSLVNVAEAQRVAKRLFHLSTSLIAVSNEVADYLRKIVRDPEKVHVVPNGVNIDRFAGTSEMNRSNSDGFTIGFIGTLKPWHGVSNLIDAFEMVYRGDATSNLTIVGDGPERANLEEQVMKQGLTDATIFAGAVSPKKIPSWLASFDVATAPYPTLSSFYFSPLKVYEYMAASLPVVASRIGQLTDLIDHEKNGILCPPDDVNALAEALSDLRQNKGKRHRLGNAARDTVLHHHSWTKVVERILKSVGIILTDQNTFAETAK